MKAFNSWGLLLLVAGGVLTLVAAGCGGPAQSSAGTSTQQGKIDRTTADASQSPATGVGMPAIEQAAAAGKYLFIFFSKADDEQTAAMRKVFDVAMEKIGERADAVAVDITSSGEKPLVDKFDLSRAPMPLVLAIAPDGGVTGGFPRKFEERQLLEAFVSPAAEKCMKLLQEGKLVLLCIQNEKTASNDAAMQGVNDFKSDQRFVDAARVVALDPADEKEAAFLADLQVAPAITEATTVFLAPPGTPIAKFDGTTEKQKLVDALSKASASCCPGGSCGPGGCGPAK